MSKNSKPVIFFGSGPVAAESLDLLSQTFEIEAVITKPRTEHHKGSVPVIDIAQKLGLKTKFAANKQELDKLFASKPFTSDLGILVDFGIIVSQEVIDYFPLGIINSHFSLLPRWRGADPITFAILSGDKQTGVSLMLLVEKMDEGPLLAQAPFKVPVDFTTPQLTKALIEVSAKTLSVIAPKYRDGEVLAALQDTSIEPTYSRKLTKGDGLVDWHKPAEQLEREVRAYAGWPKSLTELGHQQIIITKARIAEENLATGKLKVENNRLLIGTSNKSLEILRLKPAGKKEMSVAEFLRGYGQNLKA